MYAHMYAFRPRLLIVNSYPVPDLGMYIHRRIGVEHKNNIIVARTYGSYVISSTLDRTVE